MDKTVTAAPHRLESLPVGNLLLQYALPAIAAMLINQVYNLVDRIFIGQNVGALAISGLALTLPILTMHTATGMMISQGASSRLSIVLGMKDQQWAERIVGTAFLLTLISQVCFIGCILFFLDPILELLGGSDLISPYAKEYLWIVLPGCFFVSLTFGNCNLMRASGFPRKSMFIIVIGAVLNTLLDALFIWGFGWGISGAAWATVLAMVISSVISMQHFLGGESPIQLKWANVRWRGYIVRNILSIGLSPFLINLAAGGIAAVYTSSLIKHGGELAVGAFGVVNSYAMITFMVLMGLCQGMQPIVGYNFGARRQDRVRRVVFMTMIVGTALSLVAWAVIQLFPEPLARAFTSDHELIALAAHGLRTHLLALPLVAFQVVAGVFFQAISRAKISILQSLLRQVFVLFPLILLFPAMWGLEGIWIAAPVADVLSAFITFAVIYRHRSLLRSS